MAKTITFITSNSGKAEQLGYYLNYPVLHKKIDLSEIQSLRLDEIIKYKAFEAYKEVKSPVLVEDVAFTFHALGKLPGPLIKWFLQELGVKGICSLVDGYSDRTATGRTLFGLYDGKDLVTFGAVKHGIISDKPKGESSFGGVDTIFIPKGSIKTWGEMDETEQRQTSMRKIAIKKLQKYINENFNDR